jgi:hypothetical protein
MWPIYLSLSPSTLDLTRFLWKKSVAGVWIGRVRRGPIQTSRFINVYICISNYVSPFLCNIQCLTLAFEYKCSILRLANRTTRHRFEPAELTESIDTQFKQKPPPPSLTTCFKGKRRRRRRRRKIYHGSDNLPVLISFNFILSEENYVKKSVRI